MAFLYSMVHESGTREIISEEDLWHAGKKAGVEPRALVSSPNSDTSLPCVIGQHI